MAEAKKLNSACIEFKSGEKYGDTPESVLKILDVRTQPVANLTNATLATGETIYDSKVVMPTEIVCKCSLEIKDGWDKALKAIADAHNRVAFASDNSEFVTITSRVSQYKNCVLKNSPHIENAEFGDLYNFDLRFSQMIFVNENGIVHPQDSSDSNVVYVGNV